MTNLLNIVENMKFSNFEGHVVLLHFASNKKLMQIGIYLPTKSMRLMIKCAGKFPKFFRMILIFSHSL